MMDYISAAGTVRVAHMSQPIAIRWCLCVTISKSSLQGLTL